MRGMEVEHAVFLMKSLDIEGSSSGHTVIVEYSIGPNCVPGAWNPRDWSAQRSIEILFGVCVSGLNHGHKSEAARADRGQKDPCLLRQATMLE